MQPAIVVTGASSGIGRALALEAARDGAAMLLIGQSQQQLDAVAVEIAGKGVVAHVLAVDLAERGAGETIEGALSDRGLYCDVLVNSAGIGRFGAAGAISREDQLRVLDLNARVLAELSLRFLPGMLARRRGGVLNVGSITAYTPGPYMAMYFASKAFVKSFTLALAGETAGTGVTVTCLTPGVTRTPFFERGEIPNTRLFKLAPRADVAKIAAVGWRGFKAGKKVVVPRLVDRMITIACTLLTDRALVWLIATLQRQPTKEDRPGR